MSKNNMGAAGVLRQLERELMEELKSKYPERTAMGKKKFGGIEIITVVSLHHRPKYLRYSFLPKNWKVDIMICTPYYEHLASHSEEFFTKESAEEFYKRLLEELHEEYEHVKEIR